LKIGQVISFLFSQVAVCENTDRYLKEIFYPLTLSQATV
jgi:hypothetical protein